MRIDVGKGLVGVVVLEPTTSTSQTGRATNSCRKVTLFASQSVVDFIAELARIPDHPLSAPRIVLVNLSTSNEPTRRVHDQSTDPSYLISGEVLD